MRQEHTGTGVRNWSRLLGYGGLIPFFGLMLVTIVADPPTSAFAAKVLLAYGAVILSFVGAVHWGYALHHPKASGSTTLFSILPGGAAWATLLVPVAYGLTVQCIAFAAWFYYENSARIGAFLPVWYKKLRLHLTAGACLTLAFAALMSGGPS